MCSGLAKLNLFMAGQAGLSTYIEVTISFQLRLQLTSKKKGNEEPQLTHSY